MHSQQFVTSYPALMTGQDSLKDAFPRWKSLYQSIRGKASRKLNPSGRVLY